MRINEARVQNTLTWILVFPFSSTMTWVVSTVSITLHVTASRHTVRNFRLHCPKFTWSRSSCRAIGPKIILLSWHKYCLRVQFLSFYIYLCGCMLSHFTRVQLLATPQTVALQAPLFIGFSRQEYSSGLPFPSPGYLPNTGIEPMSQTLQVDSLLSELPGKPLYLCTHNASICVNTQGFPGSSAGKESTCHAEDPDSIPGSGRFPWEGIDYLLLYSCSKDPMGRGAWRATVCGVARSWTWLSD